MVYLDHSIQLFPLDPAPLRKILTDNGIETTIHYDSSHLNGLIVTGAIDNPLKCGADSFGGSTHKTLPGPHKSFLATNSERVYEAISGTAYHFVSHQQSALNSSLAITLMELEQCDGRAYGQKGIENARLFASLLNEAGVPVAGKEFGFTGCHQVWCTPALGTSSKEAAESMYNAGLIVNKLPRLPGLSGPAFRLSLAEVTRFGAQSKHIERFAAIFARLLHGEPASAEILKSVRHLREELSGPKYCFTLEDIQMAGAPPELVELYKTISKSSLT